MTSIYDSITGDDLSNSAIDFNEIDLKKLKAPLKSSSLPLSGRELSAGGGGQNTTVTAATKSNTGITDYFSIYDSACL